MLIREDLLEKFQKLDYLFEKLDWLDKNDPDNTASYSSINVKLEKVFESLTSEEKFKYFSQVNWS